MKSIAYTLNGHDNDSYMFLDGHPYGCINCKSRRINTYNPLMILKKKNFDISTTYDGYTIVSEKFVNLILEKGYKQAFIYPLLNNPSFYYFDENALPQLDVNLSESEVEEEIECLKCGFIPRYGCLKYNFVLKSNILIRGIFRSNIKLRRPGYEGPELIVGIETYKEIEEAKIKGRDFHAIKA